MENKKQTKKWTVLRNKEGCKISGLMNEEEIKKYTKKGIWTLAQIKQNIEELKK